MCVVFFLKQVLRMEKVHPWGLLVGGRRYIALFSEACESQRSFCRAQTPTVSCKLAFTNLPPHLAGTLVAAAPTWGCVTLLPRTQLLTLTDKLRKEAGCAVLEFHVSVALCLVLTLVKSRSLGVGNSADGRTTLSVVSIEN